MANIKSAEKRWRQSLTRRMRNRGARTAARTHVKNVNRAIASGEPEEAALREAVSALDKAAQKGIIHPNNAARRKSRLMTRFAAAGNAPVAEAPKRASRGRAAPKRAAGTTRSRSSAATTATRAPRSRRPASS